MRLKKSVVGMICWFIFTLSMVGVLGQNLYAIAIVVPKDEWLVEEIILLCIFIAVIGVIYGLRNGSILLQSKIKISDKKKIVFEIIGIVLWISLFFVIRILYMNQISLDTLENVYTKAASVGGSAGALSTQSISTELYIALLSFVFSFLGNKIVIAVYLQIGLQFLALLFIYGLIRTLNGRMFAFAAAVSFAVTLPVFTTIAILDPGQVMFTLFAFFIWLLGNSWRYTNKGTTNKETTNKETAKSLGCILILIFSGIITAGFLSVGSIGIWMLLMEILGLFLYKADTAKICTKKSIRNVLVYLLSVIVAFFTIQYLIALGNQQDVVSNITVMFQRIMSRFQLYPQYVFPANMLEISIAILLVASSWIFGYWKAKYDENILYVTLLLFMLGKVLWYGNDITDVLIFHLGWITVVSTGVVSILTKYSMDKRESTSSEGKDNPLPVKKECEEKNEDKNEDKNEEVIQSENNMKELEENKQEDKQENIFVPIPNPLPIPKQHIHKEMTYGIEVQESQMHYDVNDIPEDDDYDLP